MGEFPHFPAGLILLASDMARVTWPGGLSGLVATLRQSRWGTGPTRRSWASSPGARSGVGAEDLGAVFCGALVKD